MAETVPRAPCTALLVETSVQTDPLSNLVGKCPPVSGDLEGLQGLLPVASPINEAQVGVKAWGPGQEGGDIS